MSTWAYYMFDVAEVAYMIDIGEYSIPVSPDVVIMDSNDY